MSRTLSSSIISLTSPSLAIASPFLAIVFPYLVLWPLDIISLEPESENKIDQLSFFLPDLYPVYGLGFSFYRLSRFHTLHRGTVAPLVVTSCDSYLRIYKKYWKNVNKCFKNYRKTESKTSF